MYNSCKCGFNQYESNTVQNGCRNRCSCGSGNGNNCGCKPWHPAPCGNGCGCNKGSNASCGCNKPNLDCGCKPIVDSNIYYECRRVNKCDVESGFTCYCFKNKQPQPCSCNDNKCE
ncbi:MAG: hypothetical protein RSE52_05900 [Erysipelotrichaceae bacterium]